MWKMHNKLTLGRKRCDWSADCLDFQSLPIYRWKLCVLPCWLAEEPVDVLPAIASQHGVDWECHLKRQINLHVLLQILKLSFTLSCYIGCCHIWQYHVEIHWSWYNDCEQMRPAVMPLVLHLQKLLTEIWQGMQQSCSGVMKGHSCLYDTTWSTLKWFCLFEFLLVSVTAETAPSFCFLLQSHLADVLLRWIWQIIK